MPQIPQFNLINSKQDIHGTYDASHNAIQSAISYTTHLLIGINIILLNHLVFNYVNIWHQLD